MSYGHIVYLEDVDESGNVTEGQLRLLHSKVSKEPPPYGIFGTKQGVSKIHGFLMEVRCKKLDSPSPH